MKGLELCRAYWEQVGRPVLEKKCPEALARCAVGLAGEGSECFGFDDEISQDHDWGPGFCLWLTAEDMAIYGETLQKAYRALPSRYMGYTRQQVTEMTAGRVGVQTIGRFCARFLGMDRAPQTLQEWRFAPEDGLAALTNGCVFADPVGEFTALREKLMAYYPEDVRRKKLAKCCALAAQSGQYNYPRCLRRGEEVAAFLALGQFVSNVQAAVFLLNRRYKPYYKWTQRALRDLPVLGAETAALLDAVASGGNHTDEVERVSALLIGELRRQGLSDENGDFLLPHAAQILMRVEDDALRRTDMLAD